MFVVYLCCFLFAEELGSGGERGVGVGYTTMLVLLQSPLLQKWDLMTYFVSHKKLLRRVNMSHKKWCHRNY